MADIIHKIFGQKHSSKHSSDNSKGDGEGYSKHQAEFCKYEDCITDLSSDPVMYIYSSLMSNHSLRFPWPKMSLDLCKKKNNQTLLSIDRLILCTILSFFCHIIWTSNFHRILWLYN